METLVSSIMILNEASGQCNQTYRKKKEDVSMTWLNYWHCRTGPIFFFINGELITVGENQRVL